MNRNTPPVVPLTAEQRDLVERSIPIVWKIVRNHQAKFPYHNPDDLFQEAIVATCRAATRVDPARGTFCTYLHPRAVGAIYDYARDEAWKPRKAEARYQVISTTEVLDLPDYRTPETVVCQQNIQATVQEMPAADRKMFLVLICREGGATAAVMNAFNCPRSTAFQKITRFRDDYREALIES